jgi:hypothetical protein
MKRVKLFTISFLSEVQELANIDIAKAGDDLDLSSISPEYHEFAKLFSNIEAEKLLSYHSYDHTIPLEPGTTPLFSSIYLISLVELEVLRKYCEDKLRISFLRYSQSSCSAFILFVKKLDSILCLYIDYRDLNKITIKNRYSLLLIRELLDQICRAKYFTKFDIRDEYHRLRIAAGEEWKTAFRYRYSLFEYIVMLFSLCNALGIF